jgi:hypothetical protein
MASLPPPNPRALLRLRALIAELLEQRPAAELGRLIERLASEHDDRLEARIGVATWCHPGLASFVRDLAARLIGEPVTSCEYEGCDAFATVTLADTLINGDLTAGASMCEHHAAVSLLAGMSPAEARSTFRFARPVPEGTAHPASMDPACPYCVGFPCPEHQGARDG